MSMCPDCPCELDNGLCPNCGYNREHEPARSRQGLVRSMPCSAAEVESEVCEQCEGVGSIGYNPNLNPNAFPAMASAKCTRCGGTGIVEETKPQPNVKMSH